MGQSRRYIIPTYDYECEACGCQLEILHAISAEPLIECPACHKPKLVKLISPGAAIIIRGTKNPCHGGRGRNTRKKTPQKLDKLGEGANKCEMPPWRNGPVNKDVLKDPEKYIKKGKID